MKNIKIIAALLVLIVSTGLILSFALQQEEVVITSTSQNQNQFVNLFVTHGHCSTPFAGHVENLEIITTQRKGQGNPLQDMSISFDVNPQTFTVCAYDDEVLTKKVRTPDLFYNEQEEMMSFRTTEVYTMGLDWYQINGKLSIKGVEKSVKFFASGIRKPDESKSTRLILEGQFNLLDWGIDYDLIVNGKSDPVPTKMMHLNMKIDLENL